MTYDAYEGLVEADADTRWAFGGGFDDPLAGLDLTVPEGVDAAALAAYCLALGDDSLVLAQQLNGWCTRAPELEEEVALANLALDLLGQTRLLYARVVAADPGLVPALPEGSPVPPEDRLAFFRDSDDFRCVGLVQRPDADFAEAMVRLVVMSAWRLALLEGLRGSADPVLSSVATRGAREVRYHRDHAARWVVTLAQGTDESRSRTGAALDRLWPYAAELGRPDPVATRLAGVAPDPAQVWADTTRFLDLLWERADLLPRRTADDGTTDGRRGRHTSWLAPLIVEMQEVARAHPMGRW